MLTGMQIFRNFIRPREASKGETAARAAGIEIKGKTNGKP